MWGIVLCCKQVVTEALVVLKWGGVLTHSGRDQAAELGERFRNTMYPGWFCCTSTSVADSNKPDEVPSQVTLAMQAMTWSCCACTRPTATT